jgi:hypothetical protein
MSGFARPIAIKSRRLSGFDQPTRMFP